MMRIKNMFENMKIFRFLFKRSKMSNHDLGQYWEKQSQVVAPILANGFKDYVNSDAQINNAFKDSFSKSDSICCIDERVKEEGLHVAGSGIAYILGFLDQADTKDIKEIISLAAEKAASEFQSFQPARIYTHHGCGAENLVYGQLLERYGKDGITFEDPSQLGLYWANEVAKKLNINYAGRLDVDPADFHIARVIYYDATGLFTHRSVKNGVLPEGFILSRKYMNKEQCMAETNVAIGIATNDHGFGDLINSTGNNQLLLIGIGNPSDPSLSEDIIKGELEEVAQNYAGKVVVHTITPNL